MTRPRFILCSARCHPDAWSGDDDAIYLVAGTRLARPAVVRFGMVVPLRSTWRFDLMVAMAARGLLTHRDAIDIWTAGDPNGGSLDPLNSIRITIMHLSRSLAPLRLRFESEYGMGYRLLSRNVIRRGRVRELSRGQSEVPSIAARHGAGERRCRARTSGPAMS